MTTSRRLAPIALATAAVLAGCASSPRLNGAVLPMQGGTHQSVIAGPDAATALRAFDQDAKATCGTTGAIAALNKPGKYSVVSQNTVAKGGEQIASTDNKKVDAGVAVGLRYLGLDKQATVEVTTVFKCE